MMSDGGEAQMHRSAFPASRLGRLTYHIGHPVVPQLNNLDFLLWFTLYSMRREPELRRFCSGAVACLMAARAIIGGL
jgi:hypothetical protein